MDNYTKARLVPQKRIVEHSGHHITELELLLSYPEGDEVVLLRTVGDVTEATGDIMGRIVDFLNAELRRK